MHFGDPKFLSREFLFDLKDSEFGLIIDNQFFGLEFHNLSAQLAPDAAGPPVTRTVFPVIRCRISSRLS